MVSLRRKKIKMTVDDKSKDDKKVDIKKANGKKPASPQRRIDNS